jgi:hypothetical protein
MHGQPSAQGIGIDAHTLEFNQQFRESSLVGHDPPNERDTYQ